LLVSLLGIVSSSNAATISLDPGNFTKTIIESGSDSDVFELDPNQGEYSLSSSNVNITISKDITIKSSDSNQNAVINLNQLGRLFLISNTGKLTLINITINNGTADLGGAIYNFGNVTLTGCTFTNNTAILGGAIDNYDSSSMLTAENCNFIENTASSGGGAIHNVGSANLTFCNFTENRGDYGGGFYNGGNATLTFCNFTNNTAIDGGGIQNVNGATLNANNCTFTENTATDANSGGGAVINAGNATLTFCNFTKNSAIRGGGILNSGSCTLTANNCIFTGNTADEGGAIYNTGLATLNTNNCTFIENTANLGGGAIFNSLSNSLTANYCIFIENNAAYYGGAIFNMGGTTLTANYCAFIENTAGSNGGAIINYDSTAVLNVYSSVFYKNNGNRTIYIRDGTCDLKDNFYCWVFNTNNPNLSSLIDDTVYYPSGSIGSYFYMIVSHVPATSLGQNLSLNYVLFSVNGADSSKFYGDEIAFLKDNTVIPFDFKITSQNIGIAINNGNEILGFYIIDKMFYEIKPVLVSIVPTTLSSISGTGLEGTTSVNVSVNTLGTYWIVINDGTKDVFTGFYTFKSLTETITVSAILNSSLTYSVKAYDNNPAFATSVLLANSTVSIATVRLPTPTTPKNLSTTLNYTKLVVAIKSVSSLNSSKYSIRSWNALKVAYNNAKNLNKVKNASSQAEIDKLTKSLKTAKSKLVKRNVDLKITKIKRSGNKYKITIKNSGKDTSTKTLLLVSCGCKKFVKLANVKAIAKGKSIRLTVKFFKYYKTRNHNKYFTVNYKKQATETNYKNNKVKIPRFKR